WNRLGDHAFSVIRTESPYYRDRSYDLTLDWTLPLPAALESPTTPVVSLPRIVARRAAAGARKVGLWPLLASFDVYVFLWGMSLAEHNRDLPLLRALGKKIICVFLGSDVRHWSAAEPARRLWGMEGYSAYRDEIPLETKLRRLRMAELYADAIFMQPSYAELALRPYHHVYLALDTTAITRCIPGREIPRVVHAPSRAELKGTSEILQALDQLRGEGVAFDLRVLQGRPNSEVLRELREADVLVDELRESTYGMLALEAMASGCAVAGGNQGDVVPLPAERPVLPITPATLVPQLRRLLTDRDLRMALADAGGSFVDTYHAPAVVAKGMESAMLSADCDYHPGFFAWRYRLPQGERISPQLRRLSWRVVQRSGLPRGVEARDLVERELISIPRRELQQQVPRWDPGPSVVDRPPAGSDRTY
ncbi:MAG: hypothetical protein QOJ29_1580, partial [Thermoleophilaceae bacterium]|nr:hypothetical protein [Thermoleophilaceae bacterium]